MRHPELLICMRADVVLAAFIAYHLLLRADEVGDDVEEVEREEQHGSDDPLCSKVPEQSILVTMLPSCPSKQPLQSVFLHLLRAIVKWRIIMACLHDRSLRKDKICHGSDIP